jgi:hypothetical protein
LAVTVLPNDVWLIIGFSYAALQQSGMARQTQAMGDLFNLIFNPFSPFEGFTWTAFGIFLYLDLCGVAPSQT